MDYYYSEIGINYWPFSDDATSGYYLSNHIPHPNLTHFARHSLFATFCPHPRTPLQAS